MGNALPNANKAYYRVVAVDGDGKRSGESEYVEAPRPFIYSAPVTTAPAGQAYRYQVKAIRSIGDLTTKGQRQAQARHPILEDRAAEVLAHAEAGLDEHRRRHRADLGHVGRNTAGR